jgi:hypothetical protein
MAPSNDEIPSGNVVVGRILLKIRSGAKKNHISTCGTAAKMSAPTLEEILSFPVSNTSPTNLQAAPLSPKDVLSRSIKQL